MVKEHCCYLADATVVQVNLERHRGIPPKPSMQDNALDVPEVERDQVAKRPYIDETAQVVNPTILPDRFLKTFSPVLIIRHPAKQIASWYKASRVFATELDDPDFELAGTFKFSRLVFDYYKSLYHPKQNGAPNGNAQNGKTVKLHWPIVIDGDDVINDTEGMAKRFCSVTGLDPAGVIYKWEKIEPINKEVEAFQGTLSKSSGVTKHEVGLRFQIPVPC